MHHIGIRPFTFIQSHVTVLAARVEHARQDERGEGVISAALAVLIIAFLAAAMWVAYKGLFDKAAKSSEAQIDKIGA